MLGVKVYLNFDGETERAMEFYKSVLGGEFQQLTRFSEMPGGEQLSEAERERLMHVTLVLKDGLELMASDTLPSMGHVVNKGNNFSISLHPESREEAERIFRGLSAEGTVEMELQDTFWGAYFGSFRDKFGIGWMINLTQGEATTQAV